MPIHTTTVQWRDYGLFQTKEVNLANEPIDESQNDSIESNGLMGSVRYENRGLHNVPREDVVNTVELYVAPSQDDEEGGSSWKFKSLIIL